MVVRGVEPLVPLDVKVLAGRELDLVVCVVAAEGEDETINMHAGEEGLLVRHAGADADRLQVEVEAGVRAPVATQEVVALLL